MSLCVLLVFNLVIVLVRDLDLVPPHPAAKAADAEQDGKQRERRHEEPVPLRGRTLAGLVRYEREVDRRDDRAERVADERVTPPRAGHAPAVSLRHGNRPHVRLVDAPDSAAVPRALVLVNHLLQRLQPNARERNRRDNFLIGADGWTRTVAVHHVNRARIRHDPRRRRQRRAGPPI